VATLSFEEEVTAVVPRLQDLFSRVLERRCPDPDAAVTQVADALGVHRKLAWQVRNVAYAADPFLATRAMPTAAGFSSLVVALGRGGESSAVIEALAVAHAEFEELVARHAGDRDRLEMLVEAFATGGREHAEARFRERAFLGNRFIWGVETKTQLSATILTHSATREGWLDYAQLRGFIRLRRVRPDRHWVLNQSVVIDDREDETRREPLDPACAAAMGGVPLLGDFSSMPLPELRRREAPGGFLNDELLPAPVGVRGQQTILTGELIRELAPATATHRQKRALFGAGARTPAEVFLFDHFVHRDLFPHVERELCVFGELHNPISQDDHDRLPVAETLDRLGRGLRAARTPDVPGYLDLLEWTFARLGWDPDQFDAYRVRLAFPPIPSTVVIRHDLPDPPT
jgi:hypothetical protein